MEEPATQETEQANLCRKCGAHLFAQDEICPACLLETALEGTAEEDQAPSRLGDFDDYELLAEIGRGGQGVVYRARQKSLNRIVALKIIGLGRWASTPHLRRFRQEAEAAARLEHPQIVPIYEIGEGDGSCFFSMKFIEGGPLDEVVRREPMPVRRAAELLAQIARTVQFAHEHGILHRDIKPGNVLLDRAGQPHLTDFGLARLIENQSTVTNSFDVLGTPSYMAPEQAAGETKSVTASADVYSLGAVFYHLLTGEPPFAGGTTYETIRQVLEREPLDPRRRNPKVDADVATICLKCLDKKPDKRYPSAAALADDLDRWLRYEPIRARRTGMLGRGQRWLRRNPAQAVAIAALLAALAAVGVLVEKSDLVANRAGKGIAILPFENLSADPQQSFFADGVQDGILTRLAKLTALRVISRTSVMQFREARNLREVGSVLHVSHVLTGSVLRTANHLRVNAQLIDAREDKHVWAETFDRDVIETFAVQGEIAQKVAEFLHVRVTTAEKQSLTRAPTADLSAFDLYTRGRNLYLQTGFSNINKEQLLEAANLLTQAVTRDPSLPGLLSTRVASPSSLRDGPRSFAGPRGLGGRRLAFGLCFGAGRR